MDERLLVDFIKTMCCHRRKFYQKCIDLPMDFRGLCIINDNVVAHKCALVQEFIEKENMVQFLHPP